MPEQHEHGVVVSCLHFRVVFPVTNVDPATLSILLVCVSLPFSGSSRGVISLVEWEGGANAGAWVQLLWEYLALAGCAGRGWVPSQTHLLLWRLDGASWGQRGRGEALGVPLPYIITLGTSNNLPVTSVVLTKELAWFILEVTVFMVCMSVKSACLSWGSKSPRAYQYHCIHSSLTRIEQ